MGDEAKRHPEAIVLKGVQHMYAESRTNISAFLGGGAQELMI